MKDFLGHEYGPGDLVIYGAMSGRSVNMVIGRVLEVYDVFRSRETYRWTRLEPGQLAPFKTKYGWFDGNGDLHLSNQDGECDWREYETEEREETVTKVKIEPLRAARWTQHHGHDYYVDTRSGRRIDPWKGSKHQLVAGHYIDTRTGEEIDERQRYQHLARPARLPYVPSEHTRYIRTEFQPWVEKRHDAPKAVTIEITENIVKWEGALPDDPRQPGDV